jgi:hypothetical protein
MSNIIKLTGCFPIRENMGRPEYFIPAQFQLGDEEVSIYFAPINGELGVFSSEPQYGAAIENQVSSWGITPYVDGAPSWYYVKEGRVKEAILCGDASVFAIPVKIEAVDKIPYAVITPSGKIADAEVVDMPSFSGFSMTDLWGTPTNKSGDLLNLIGEQTARRDDDYIITNDRSVYCRVQKQPDWVRILQKRNEITSYGTIEVTEDVYNRYNAVHEALCNLGYIPESINGVPSERRDSLGYWEMERHQKILSAIKDVGDASNINPPKTIRYARKGIAEKTAMWWEGSRLCYFLKGDVLEYGIN